MQIIESELHWQKAKCEVLKIDVTKCAKSGRYGPYACIQALTGRKKRTKNSGVCRRSMVWELVWDNAHVGSVRKTETGVS